METREQLRTARTALRDAAHKARDAARLLDLSADALLDVELNKAIKADDLAAAASWEARQHAALAAVSLDQAKETAANVAR